MGSNLSLGVLAADELELHDREKPNPNAEPPHLFLLERGVSPTDLIFVGFWLKPDFSDQPS